MTGSSWTETTRERSMDSRRFVYCVRITFWGCVCFFAAVGPSTLLQGIAADNGEWRGAVFLSLLVLPCFLVIAFSVSYVLSSIAFSAYAAFCQNADKHCIDDRDKDAVLRHVRRLRTVYRTVFRILRADYEQFVSEL